ncbi:hypothetical protein DM01DRAFT_109789 [Hesseltinella vesiculosa]|uniref:Uncharacterized protein n=1 Tax=Hesseltinella vesiculosa TaxID=101127 RepID=A0A1X2GPE4_9FUNG|nr:hypothetical protein DM01DRAFT_109789 [Hesseltinella vesiculosa]
MAAQKSGIAVGLNHGHITTRRELKQKVSQRKGVRILKEMDGWAGWMDGDDRGRVGRSTFFYPPIPTKAMTTHTKRNINNELSIQYTTIVDKSEEWMDGWMR